MTHATLGQPALAIEAELRRRVAADPNNSLLLCQLGELLRQRGDFAAAEPLARNAVRLTPESFDAQRLLGLVFSQTHRNPAGEFHLRRAIALAPPTGILLTSLALNLSSQGRYEEAEAFFAQACTLEPANARYLVAQANSAELDRRWDKAESLLAQAERIDPTMLEIAMVRADVLTRRKHYNEALALLDRTRPQAEAHPSQAPAHGLRRANVLDKLGRYDEAFAACVAAKQRFRQLGGRYQRDEAVKFFERFRRFFTRQRAALLPRATVREHEPQPLFIIGFPRSGTTLTEQIFGSHADVVSGGELFVIDRVCAASQDVLSGPLHYPECLIEAWMGDREWSYDLLRDLYLQEAQAHGVPKSGPRYFTDKTPFNGPHLGLISLLFPQSPIIHLLRHPLDSVLSSFFTQMSHGYGMACDLTSIAEHYVLVADLIDHYRDQLDLNYLAVRYEDIVADQEGASRKLLGFAGLDWDDRCLNFHEHASGVRTASYAQVTEKLYTRSVYRYRHYREHLEPVLPILRPVIERMGYEVER
jgi:tetratricopeptide (TPR) repeat protein